MVITHKKSVAQKNLKLLRAAHVPWFQSSALNLKVTARFPQEGYQLIRKRLITFLGIHGCSRTSFRHPLCFPVTSKSSHVQSKLKRFLQWRTVWYWVVLVSVYFIGVLLVSSEEVQFTVYHYWDANSARITKSNGNLLILLLFFFFKFENIKSFLWVHWYPCLDPW